MPRHPAPIRAADVLVLLHRCATIPEQRELVGKRFLHAQCRARVAARIRQDLERPAIMPHRVFSGVHLACRIASRNQRAGRPIRVGESSSAVQVMRDSRRIDARLPIEPLHRVRHTQVEPLAAQLRDRVGQQLTGQRMFEPPRDLATPGRSFDDAGPLGFVQRSDQGVTLDARHVFEQIRLEVTPDHRGGFQYVLRLRDTRCSRRSSTTRRCRGARSRRNRVGASTADCVKQPSFVLQVTKQLGDKKRVSTGVVGESVDEPGWRIATGRGRSACRQPRCE